MKQHQPVVAPCIRHPPFMRCRFMILPCCLHHPCLHVGLSVNIGGKTQQRECWEVAAGRRQVRRQVEESAASGAAARLLPNSRRFPPLAGARSGLHSGAGLAESSERPRPDPRPDNTMPGPIGYTVRVRRPCSALQPLQRGCRTSSQDPAGPRRQSRRQRVVSIAPHSSGQPQPPCCSSSSTSWTSAGRGSLLMASRRLKVGCAQLPCIPPAAQLACAGACAGRGQLHRRCMLLKPAPPPTLRLQSPGATRAPRPRSTRAQQTARQAAVRRWAAQTSRMRNSAPRAAARPRACCATRRTRAPSGSPTWPS